MNIVHPLHLLCSNNNNKISAEDPINQSFLAMEGISGKLNITHCTVAKAKKLIIFWLTTKC
jgi:hypothetical protein